MLSLLRSWFGTRKEYSAPAPYATHTVTIQSDLTDSDIKFLAGLLSETESLNRVTMGQRIEIKITETDPSNHDRCHTIEASSKSRPDSYYHSYVMNDWYIKRKYEILAPAIEHALNGLKRYINAVAKRQISKDMTPEEFFRQDGKYEV
jgi:hypothetical protein